MSSALRVVKTYRLVKLLDTSGGAGDVYEAVQQLGDAGERRVAVKVIKPAYANQPDFIRSFENEAKTVAGLEHPRIVPLVDYWREAGEAFLVMRWMHRSLVDPLYGRSLSLEQSLRIFEHVAEALAFAHKRNVVHRDIKPANILLDEEQNAYLADFGIAKDLRQGGHATAQQSTPGYAAPEQIYGMTPTSQADIYSLGVLLFELLTGRRAYSGDDAVRQQIEGPPLRPVQVRPGLPPDLDSIVQRATARRPEDRFTDAATLAAAVRRAFASPQAASSPQALPREIRPLPRPATPVLDLYDLQNPYKGLRAFQEADASDFYGREEWVARLIERLAQAGPDGRFLPVIGPSGSGKSSVVRAGLLPALRAGRLPGAERWFFVDLQPGAQPLEALERALLRVAVQPGLGIGELLRADELGLVRAAQLVLPHEPEVELLLLIDQFEELFSQVRDQEARARAIDLLLVAVQAPESRLRIVLTMRADFIDEALRFPGFGPALTHGAQFLLPLTHEQIDAAIRLPVARAGIAVAPELVAAIVRDIGNQPGALPLLQYALYELFEERQGRTLTLASYQQSGGVFGALSRRAELLFEQLGRAQQDAARQIFLRLVTLGEGSEDTRRRVRRDELLSLQSAAGSGDGAAALVQEVIARFGRARLLTFDHDPQTRFPTVELAHETLLRTWGRLRGWLDEARADVRLQRRLAEETAAWEDSGRDPSFLARAAKLQQFDQLAATANVALSREERTFLDASRALASEEQRQLDAERQRRRTVRRLTYVLGAAAILCLTLLAFFASNRAQEAHRLAVLAAEETERAEAQAQRAEAQAQLNIAETLAAQAVTIAGNEDEYDLALMLSLEAERMHSSLGTRSSLLNGVLANPTLTRYLRGHADWVRDVVFSSDGSTFVTVSNDERLLVWNSASQQLRQEALLGHAAAINVVATSPASSAGADVIASGDASGEVILWDLASGAELQRLETLPGAISGLAFNPGGNLLAVAAENEEEAVLRVYTLASSVAREITRTERLDDIAWNSDGSVLAANVGGVTHLWDAQLRALPETLEHDDTVFSLTFHPTDPDVLATGDNGGSVFLWDLDAPAEPVELFDQAGQIYDLDISRDGARLAAVGSNRLVAVWDVASRTLIGQGGLRGHAAAVWGVAFNPVDANVLVSVGADNAAILWDLNDYIRPGTVVQAASADAAAVTLWGLVYNPAGTLLATGDNAGTVALFAADGDLLLDSLDTGDEAIYGLAFSRAGSHLAAVTIGGTAYVWSVADEPPMLVEHAVFLPADEGRTGFALAFNADDTELAVAYDNGVVRRWDLARQTELSAVAIGTSAILSVSYHPQDPHLLAVANGNRAELWATDSGERVMELSWLSNRARNVLFSPDGATLFASSLDNSITLWDVASGDELAKLKGHRGDIWALAVSPDGAMLASGGADGRIILWDLETYRASGRRLFQRIAAPISAHSETIFSLSFRPDSKRLASGGGDGNLLAWDLDVQSWKAIACMVAAPDDLLMRRLEDFQQARQPGPPLCPGQELDAAVRAVLLGDERPAGELFAATVASTAQSDDAAFLNRLCWEGSTLGFAAEVLPACERAVALRPSNGNYRDSRGLALALTGEMQAALEDFRSYIPWARAQGHDEQLIDRRLNWIERLERGENPFDAQLARELWNE